MSKTTKYAVSLMAMICLSGAIGAAHAAPPACTPGAFESEARGFSVSAVLTPQKRQLAVGETLSIQLKANQDARVTIYNIAADGKVQSLVQDADNGILLRKGKSASVPAQGSVLRVAEPLGRNRLVISFEQISADPKPADAGAMVTFDQQVVNSANGLLVTHLSGGKVLEGAICFDVVAGS